MRDSNRDLELLKTSIQESQCKVAVRQSMAHALVPNESVSTKRVGSRRFDADGLDSAEGGLHGDKHTVDQKAFRKVVEGSRYDFISKYHQALSQVQTGSKPV